jgi:hypothetical protein
MPQFCKVYDIYGTQVLRYYVPDQEIEKFCIHTIVRVDSMLKETFEYVRKEKTAEFLVKSFSEQHARDAVEDLLKQLN